MIPSPVFLDLRGGSIRRMEQPSEPLVLCLGNFDGVHLAHASLLRQGLTLRNERLPEGLCGVFTFFRPSFDYLQSTKSLAGDSDAARAQQKAVPRRQAPHRHLTTLKEKLRCFAELGMDFVCLCDFEKIRALSPQQFLEFLSGDLGARGAVCGFNFHFGLGGQGNAELLSRFFDNPQKGYFCAVAPEFRLDGDTVSASRIRELLMTGQTETAVKHLGRPYALEATVVHGKQLGRSLGFPTANQLFPLQSIIPAHGVYAVLCYTPLGMFPGVANVGSHPTVDRHGAVNCETYILCPPQDLYGYRLRVEFLCRLREEKKFDSIEALTRAIAEDTERAAAYTTEYLAKHRQA